MSTMEILPDSANSLASPQATEIYSLIPQPLIETTPRGDRPETVTIQDTITVGSNAVRWTLETSENREYDGVVLIGPGIACSERMLAGLRHQLAERGYSALTWKPARKSDSPLKVFTDPLDVHVRTQRAIMEAISDNPDIRRKAPQSARLDTDRTITAAYSMYSETALRTAQLEKARTDMVVGVGGIGFDRLGPKSGWLLGSLAMMKEIGAAVRSGDIELGEAVHRETLEFYMRLQSLGELRHCPKETTRVQREARELQETGTPVGYVALGRDMFAPPSAEIARRVSRYVVLGGITHMGPITKPDQVAQGIIAIERSRAKPRRKSNSRKVV